MRKFLISFLVLVLCVGGIESLYGFWPSADGHEVATIAGTGGHGALDGSSAQFNLPFGVAGAPGGGIIVADTFNNVLRRVSSPGVTSTFAGTVLEAGDDNFPIGFHYDSSLSNAGFNRPTSVAVDALERIFVADSQNHAIRVILDDMVFTFAGGNGAGHTNGNRNVSRFNKPGAIAVCPDGNLFVADTGNHVIRKITPEGITSTIAGQAGRFGYANGRSALFDSPQGIAVGRDGRVFVADTGNNVIRVIDGDSTSTLAGSSISNLHDAYGDGWDSAPLGFFADDIGIFAMFNQPAGLAFWGDYLIVADSANHAIRAVSQAGEVRTLLGNGNPGFFDVAANMAIFHFPTGVYVQGNMLFIADTGNNMIRAVTLN